jgi:hypothetical protein
MEAKTQSAARLTSGANTSTDQSGEKPILLRMRPMGVEHRRDHDDEKELMDRSEDHHV